MQELDEAIRPAFQEAAQKRLDDVLHERALQEVIAEHPEAAPTLYDEAYALAHLTGEPLADHSDIIRQVCEQLEQEEGEPTAQDVMDRLETMRESGELAQAIIRAAGPVRYAASPEHPGLLVRIEGDERVVGRWVDGAFVAADAVD